MLIILSGPQHARSKAIKALESARFHVVRDEHGDAITSSWGHPDSTEKRWTGAVYTAADIARLDEDDPGHGHAVGDLLRGTGKFVPVAAKAPVGWITLDDDEARVNDAAKEVAELKWVLRAHGGELPKPKKELTVEQKLARLGLTKADLPELKRLIGA